MATQEQVQAALIAVKDQLVKVKNEVITRIDALVRAVENAGSSTPAVDEAIAGLQDIADQLDSINPDAEVPPLTPEVPADPPVVTDPPADDGEVSDRPVV